MKEPFVRCIKFLFLITLWLVPAVVTGANISIAYRTDSPQLSFAVSRLEQALRQVDQAPVLCDLSSLSEPDILIVADLARIPDQVKISILILCIN